MAIESFFRYDVRGQSEAKQGNVMLSSKQGIVAFTLIASLSAQAAVLQERCKGSLDACGIAFTSIAPTPSDLTTANCFSAETASYVIENQGATDTVINFAVVDNDSLGTDAVVIDASSTCTNGQTLNSLESCTIVLDYQPCDSGTLDRDLTVTPVSTQRPLVVAIDTSVGTSAFVYCPAY
jgi:hypothetical protein